MNQSVPAPFPRPRTLDWLGGAASPHAAVRETRDPTLPAEGYRLHVDDEVDLAYADDAGRRYAHQTLGQLRGDPAGLPRCHVEDHPDLGVRGHMLDISRDRVPTRETLSRLVERLAGLRFNHLQLYTEHTFAYRDHEVVWRAASPMTPDDMRWLDDLCDSHGIELAANQNTFGHMERWLAHDAYRHRAETPDGWHRGDRVVGPTALAPTPDNAEFALSLVRELAATVRSRRVNIGCDEVWELGMGRSAAEVERRGRAAVFVEHLRRLAEPLLADGFDVQFWADMVQQAPADAAPLAAAGAIAAVWGYEAPGSLDPDELDLDALPEDVREAARRYFEAGGGAGFGARLAAFAESGLRTWVVPGTSGWNSFVGRHGNARGNVLDAADAALAHGAEGLLVTEWGDNGHQQPPFVTLPALAYAGGTAWCRATNGDLDDGELAAAVDRLLGDGAERIGGALVRLGRLADRLGLRQPNGTQFFYAAVSTGQSWRTERPEPDTHRDTLAEVDGAVEDLAAAAPTAVDGDLLLRETRQAAALARYGLRLLASLHAFDGAPSDAELDAELTALVAEQRECWLARSRPGGLEDSLARLRGRRDGG